MMALNVGVLANMARGNTEYDATAASAAAGNLVAISQIDQSFHWPEGTDNFALDGTRALPAIWENLPDVIEKWQAFGAAAEGLAEVAGRRARPDARGARPRGRHLRCVSRRLPAPRNERIGSGRADRPGPTP